MQLDPSGFILMDCIMEVVDILIEILREAGFAEEDIVVRLTDKNKVFVGWKDWNRIIVKTKKGKYNQPSSFTIAINKDGRVWCQKWRTTNHSNYYINIHDPDSIKILIDKLKELL